MKAKRAKPSRVYPAESDPRQWKISHGTTEEAPKVDPGGAVDSAEGVVGDAPRLGGPAATRVSASPGTVALLASEFGPWVRGADGRWFRKRPLKTTKET